MEQNFWKNRIREGAVQNPIDRIAEILFGLIMVLTFTGTISVATDGKSEIRELLWAALGCNLAWGLVDAIMYLMDVLMERGHGVVLIKKIMKAESDEASRKIMREEIQPFMASLLKDEEVDQLVKKMKALPPPPAKHLLTGKDFIIALQIFLLVFLCTFPVALPFAVFDDVAVAMRASNGVALLLLFIAGYILAGYAGFRRFLTALVYTIIGVCLVAMTMALGG